MRPGPLDEAEHSVGVLLVDDGTHRRRGVQRVARRHRRGALDESARELVGDRRVQQQSGVRRAHRALVVERAEDRLVHRLIQIGVGEDEVRALAAALQPHLFGVRVRRVAQEPLAGLCRPGEGDDVDVVMTAQSLAGGRAQSGHDVQHAVGQARLDRELRQPNRRERRLLGGFEDDTVAGGQRRRDLPDRQVQWEVPRCHGTDDAERLAGDQAPGCPASVGAISPLSLSIASP